MIQTANWPEIQAAKKAALEVLLHNANGSYNGLPRTNPIKLSHKTDPKR